MRVNHVSKYARYGRKTIGWLFIPQPDYKNMIGWFRLVFKKKENIVTNAIKNEIVKCCMLIIRNGVLRDERAVTGFVKSKEWHRSYALSPGKVKELVLRI